MFGQVLIVAAKQALVWRLGRLEHTCSGHLGRTTLGGETGAKGTIADGAGALTGDGAASALTTGSHITVGLLLQHEELLSI